MAKTMTLASSRRANQIAAHLPMPDRPEPAGHLPGSGRHSMASAMCTASSNSWAAKRPHRLLRPRRIVHGTAQYICEPSCVGQAPRPLQPTSGHRRVMEMQVTECLNVQEANAPAPAMIAVVSLRPSVPICSSSASAAAGPSTASRSWQTLSRALISGVTACTHGSPNTFTIQPMRPRSRPTDGAASPACWGSVAT